MAISGYSVPFGYTIRCDIEGHPSLKEIHADGLVDKAFVQADCDEFISDIEDARVRDFARTGLPPNADWEQTAEGQWSYGHQQLMVADRTVTLKSWIEENDEIVDHFIVAPFRPNTGAAVLKKSSEGFHIAATNGG